AFAVGTELSFRDSGVGQLTKFGAASDQFLASSLNVGDDQVKALSRARHCRRHLRAELDRAPRARRRELDDAETVVKWEVGVQPRPKLLVELLRAIHIRDGN